MADIDDLITNLNKLASDIRKNTSAMKGFIGYQQSQTAGAGLTDKQKQDIKNQKNQQGQIADSAKSKLKDFEKEKTKIKHIGLINLVIAKHMIRILILILVTILL